MSDVIAVVGTLAGTVVGSMGTLLTQWLNQQHQDRQALTEMRRTCYAQFLGQLASLYGQTRVSYNELIESGELAVTELRSKLATLDPAPCQSALDELRFSATHPVLLAADKVFKLVRRIDVVRGQMRAENVSAWVDEYWTLRRAFVSAARKELKIADGDIHEVEGVVPDPRIV